MRIYDEENPLTDGDDDEMSGYTVIEENSIYKLFRTEEPGETVATPIPDNEQTVIICEPSVSRISDGDELSLVFDGDNCAIKNGAKKVGSLKPAYVKKLKTERGGALFRVFYKLTTPPMVRIVFGEGAQVPIADAE